jgi:hypothetical protein
VKEKGLQKPLQHRLRGSENKAKSK